MGADRIDTGLVVAAAVGVHQRFQQRQHGAALTRQPVEDRLFVFGGFRHAGPCAGRNLAQADPMNRDGLKKPGYDGNAVFFSYSAASRR